MSVLVNSEKLAGRSATSVSEYLKEEIESLVEYYGIEQEGIAFRHALGTGAGDLGLTNGITQEQFEDLHHGRWNGKQQVQVGYQPVWAKHPDGKLVYDDQGKKVKTYDANGKMITVPYRTSWIDAVTAPDKSFIEYMIHTTPEVRKQMLEVWDRGIAEGVKNLEERGFLVRQTIKGTYVEGTKQQGSATERVRGAHIVAIPVNQFSARHTDESRARGGPPDAHMHTHIAIATMAWLPDPTHPEGMRPLTIDHKSVVNMEEEMGATVSGVVAKGLEDMGIELGYDQSRRGNITWKIKGITKEAERFHSTNSGRRQAIEDQFERDYGKPATRAQVDELMRKSRKSKSQTGLDKEADTRGAWPAWLDQLKGHGIDLGLLTPGAPVQRETVLQRKQKLYDRLMASNGLCKEHAFFSGDSILKSIKIAGVGLGFTQDELAAMETDIRRELVLVRPAADDRYSYFTTKVEVAREHRIERGIDNMATQPAEVINWEAVDSVLAAQTHALDPQQLKAFFAGITQPVVFVEGVAGAGKSSTIKAVIDYHRKVGQMDQAVVASTAANVAQDSGIKMGADAFGAVEGIEAQVKNGIITPSARNLYVIDEAAMMDNDHIDRLFMAARGQGKFIFVGDPAQLSPIGAGGWYQDALAKHDPVMLDKSHRFDGPQAEQDVRDYTLLRNGNIDDARTAVESMAKRGRIHELDTADERVQAAFAKYQEIRDSNPNVTADDIRILIETSNKDVDNLARHVQFDQKQRGELGKGLRVNDEDQGRQWSLHENESVVFLRSYIGTEQGDKPIKNGTKARIVAIDEETREATIKLADERETKVKLPEFERSAVMAPAGAQHAAKAQGGEFDYVITLPGTERTANANSGYSQHTRAKKESHAFIDRETHGPIPRETLAESWAERVDKRTALSVIREHGESIGLDTPYEKSAAEWQKRRSTDLEQDPQREPQTTAAPEQEVEQEVTRDPRSQQSPISVLEKEDTRIGEPRQQQPKETEAEGHQEHGSLRERFTHLRRGRDRERDVEREERRSPVDKELSHLRSRGQEHGLDRGL